MPSSPPYPGPPRWAKVLGIIALVAVLLLIILMLTRGPGGHGPGRHAPSGDAGGQTPAAGTQEQSHTPPAGGPDHAPPASHQR